MKFGKHFLDDKDERDIYRITLKRGKIKYSFNFGQSINSSRYPKIKPSVYDIFACLQKYDPETFEDFCAEFGYDTDSKKPKQHIKQL